MAWLSLIPAIISIVLTFKTKKLIISLFSGVLVGSLISKGLINGLIGVGEYMMEAVDNKSSAYTLSFLLAAGALVELIKMSGGISGFSEKVSKRIKTERDVFLWSWLLSIVTFFDSSFHNISVGSILTPILTRVKGSKEKFAFILSVTSIQLIMILPVATAFFGYMISLVSNDLGNIGIKETAYSLVVKSFVWNFFSISMILIAVCVSIFGLGFGKYRIGKYTDEQVTNEPVDTEKLKKIHIKEYPQNSKNLIVPVVFLIISTFFFLWWTGRDASSSFFGAFSSAKVNVAIFSGMMTTLLVTIIYYLTQKISLSDIQEHAIKGAGTVVSLIVILTLSWALTAIVKDLGFNTLLSGGFIQSIPKFLLPAIIFLLSGIVSYTIGSSWATWALMLPLAINCALNAPISLSIMMGTVWAGGAVSDIVSPLSAQMSDISYGNHLTSSLPYVICGVIISTLGYVIVGLFLI